MSRPSIAILLTIALISCSATWRQESQMPIPVSAHFEVVDTTQLITEAMPLYPMVSIPENIREPVERGRYTLAHFFDLWEATSLEQVIDPKVLEQGIVDYLYVYSSMPAESVSKVDLLRPLAVMRGDALREVLKLYTKYLYESDSPLKNSDSYVQALEWAINSPQVDYVDQVIYKDMYALVSKNQVGTPASDFAMTLALPTSEGYTFEDKTLYGLQDKPKVIVFYTPGCDHCTQLLQEIAHDTVLQRATQGNKIQILYLSLVYEHSEWVRDLSNLPTFGTPAFNADMRILNESLYDLTVTPVVYVVSPEGRVLQREATLAEVRQYVITL